MQCVLIEFFLVYPPCMIQQRIDLVAAEVPNGNDMSRFLSLPLSFVRLLDLLCSNYLSFGGVVRLTFKNLKTTLCLR
jgi:hypothetical protein